MQGMDRKGAALLLGLVWLLAGCSLIGDGANEAPGAMIEDEAALAQEGRDGPDGKEAARGDGPRSLEPQSLEKVPVRVRHGGGAADTRLSIELALTPEQQEKGLMHRARLAPGEGMLFPFLPPRSVSFWMKDTLVPLDLLFIAPDGRIARIAAGAKPQDLSPLFADVPVAAVLELGGGQARALGIGEGDRVNWGSCVAQPGRKTAEAANFCPAG